MENTFSDFGKPEGNKGEKLLDQMDEGHTPVSLWALTNIDIKEDDLVLDIGCGSGLNIKRLHEKSPKARTYGVDYSSTSVKKSKKMNKKQVDEGNVIIKQANVIDMPFDDDSFDVITAFETVYFWQDIVNSFREVKRILKTDGQLCLILDANGCSDNEIKKKADSEGCKFYTDTELKQLLLDAGYTNITVYIRNRSENTKIIKSITPKSTSESKVEEIFDYDNYEKEASSEDYIFSSEWICIIAKK